MTENAKEEFKIDINFLKSLGGGLNPVQPPNRWESFEKANPGWSGTALEFMELSSISNEDKIWVLLREPILRRAQLIILGCKFCEDVLYMFKQFNEKDEYAQNAIHTKALYAIDEGQEDNLHLLHSECEKLLEDVLKSVNKSSVRSSARDVIRAIMWNTIGGHHWLKEGDSKYGVVWYDTGSQIRDVA